MGHFTTKIQTHTGPFASFQPKSADIKRKGKKVGYICQSSSRLQPDAFTVRFAFVRAPTQQSPASFRWASLTRKFTSFKEALEHVRSMPKPTWNDDLYEFID